MDRSKTELDQTPAISAPDTWLQDTADWIDDDNANNNAVSACFKVAEPWGADSWAIPREFATGALFSAQKRGRTFLVNEKINTNDNVDLHGTGESLLQYDLDVFACIAHQGRAGDPISFRLRDFIVDLRGAGKGPRSVGDQGRPTDSVGGASVVSALNSIARMADFEIALTVKKNGDIDYSYNGRLIDTATVVIGGVPVAVNDETARLKGLSDLVVSLTLNPEMAVLFEKRRRVYLNPKTRSSFSKSPLVLWLYAFLRSHRNPFDLPLEYFLEKCGSTSKKAEFSRMMAVARKRLRKGKVVYSSKMVKGKLHFQMQPPSPKARPALKPAATTPDAGPAVEAPDPGKLH